MVEKCGVTEGKKLKKVVN